jgi:hypothetical protein
MALMEAATMLGAGVAAAGAAEGFAERAGENIDAAHHVVMLVRAAAARAHKADGVGVVNHHERAVFIGEVADDGEVCEITVHRKHTVGDNQNAARALGLGELRGEVGHVVVLVAEALGLAEAHAIDDGGVVEFVGNDGVLGAEQRLEQTAVGVETRRVKDGVLGAEKVGELFLELFVDFLRAANEPYAGETIAPFVERLMRGGDDLRMVREAKVIIGAHVQHRRIAPHAHARSLRRVDDALAFVQTRRSDFVQLGLQLRL